MAKKKSRKIKVPKSLMTLAWSPEKYAKKKNYKLNSKKLSKKERKRLAKRFEEDYSKFVIKGMNRAVKILMENPSEDNKKVVKLSEAVEKIIQNPKIMKKVAKKYTKESAMYENMMYLPSIIMNTIVYYNREDISDEDKEIAESLDKEFLVKFCEKILKKQIKRYKDEGLSQAMAFQLATTVPSAKCLTNRLNYKRLIRSLYNASNSEDVDIYTILKSIRKVDRKKVISKEDLAKGFFGEVIFMKDSNKKHAMSDKEKEFHEDLIEKTIEYLDSISKAKSRDIIKEYIHRRKIAESYKTDCRRVIKFVDFANSNSTHTKLKSVIVDLIAAKSDNEIYLQ